MFEKMKFGIIVHGGAGDIPRILLKYHKEGTEAACNVGYNILEQHGSALDAVEECICVLENNPTFDAGIGSFPNEAGEIEMDAMIAGDNWNIGSVFALQNIQNPIRVARLVLENTKHIILAGNGAKNLAIHQKFPQISLDELDQSRELRFNKNYLKIRDKRHQKKKFGTVGCVCYDQDGHFAIGTSTGGAFMKKVGRIGDTALWGAGGYVDSYGGSVATGLGEDLIRILITRIAINALHQGKSPQVASEHAINKLAQELQSQGGVITMSEKAFGYHYNTSVMGVAFRNDEMSHVDSNL